MKIKPVLVVLTLLAAAAMAQQVSVSADTFTSIAYPGNYGTAQLLYVTGTQASSPMYKGAGNQAWLRFQIPKLPLGFIVARATLSVYADHTYGPMPMTVQVWSDANLVGGWSEASPPAPNEDMGGSNAQPAAMTVTGSGTVATADVTTLVDNALLDNTNDPATVGFMLQASSASLSSAVALDSKENTGASHPAQLSLLVYLPPSGESSYTTPGTFSFTVPAGVVLIEVQARGADGGTGLTDDHSTTLKAGQGGYIDAYLRVTPGQNLAVQVGQEGQDAVWADHPYQVCQGEFPQTCFEVQDWSRVSYSTDGGETSVATIYVFGGSGGDQGGSGGGEEAADQSTVISSKSGASSYIYSDNVFGTEMGNPPQDGSVVIKW